MTENEIAEFAARLSRFRRSLSKDEQDILDSRFAKSGDDVEAHGFRMQNVMFEIEGDAYRVARRASKAGDEDDVSAHARS